MIEMNEIWIDSKGLFERYRHEIREYARKYRLQNYGYDFKTFKKMSAQKTIMNHSRVKDNNFYGIYKRFYLTKDGKIHYCCGQSQNEEMMTVLSCLTGKYTKEWRD